MPKDQRHGAAAHQKDIRPTLGFIPTLTVAFGVPYATLVLVFWLSGSELTKLALLHATCFLLAIANYKGIPNLLRALKTRGMCNRNLHRDEDCDKVPEPGSIWACILYILYLIVVKVAYKGNQDMVVYSSALVSITVMTLLGLIDDILPLSLMTKLAAPTIAAIPLCLAFNGETKIITPSITPLIGRRSLDLGWAYHIGIVFFIIFFANAINIHAGINGLEVGQATIMAVFLLAHNSIEIVRSLDRIQEAGDVIEKQLFSVQLTLPFLAINVALLCYNWYPATLFVGNMYTSMAGILFAVIATLCGCTRVMMLLFLPQLINFVLSIPQIIGIKHCPRFRTPRYHSKTDLLEYSDNYTLLNAFLWALGPMTERRLCVMTLGFQAICCACGLVINMLIS